MTTHSIIVGNSNHMASIADGSVNLIVTSPPYPMIEMWDKIFAGQDPEIEAALENNDGMAAFYRMHAILNDIWRECDRVLAENGFVCINIGDATRSINDKFELYSNHTQIINTFLTMGYSVLPDIHWRKQSNAPNKFMGSGMYPAGAYVTYEHEYILVFRKGGKRVFNGEGRTFRRKSAYFWEERNVWFSDLWDIKGASQRIIPSAAERSRNASFPLEIPLRLVSMYSVEGDVVLDPFAGLGMTAIACMIAKRNSIGVEIDSAVAERALANMVQGVGEMNRVIEERVERHRAFVQSLPEDKKVKCYQNVPHGFPVKTRQETEIEIKRLTGVTRSGNVVTCSYEKYS